MKPFSLKKRLAYLFACIVIFIVAIPFIVLYASGYRLGQNFTLVKTGGIYIRAESGATLLINGKEERGLGTFGSSFFVQNIRPGIYEISVQKNGRLPWRKNIAIYEGIVSEASAFLFPEVLTIEPLAASSNDAALVERVSELFAEPGTPGSSGSTGILEAVYAAVRDDVGIWHENGVVYAKWLRSRQAIPSAFCIYTICRTAFPVFTTAAPITNVDFFPGRNDVVLIGTTDSVFVAEIDKTPPQHRYPLYLGKDVDFRIEENTGRLFIRDGKDFKEIVI